MTSPLVVTAGEGPPLLGRDCLAAFHIDWKNILFHGDNTLAAASVLREGLGELQVKARFYVDEGEQLWFYPPPEVSFAIRGKELERLQALGVIRPV